MSEEEVLKIFEVHYDSWPEQPDRAIWIAKSKSDLLEMLKNEADKNRDFLFATDETDEEGWAYFKVDKAEVFETDFDEMYAWEDLDKEYFNIYEVPMERGHVYTGNNCC